MIQAFQVRRLQRGADNLFLMQLGNNFAYVHERRLTLLLAKWEVVEVLASHD